MVMSAGKYSVSGVLLNLEHLIQKNKIVIHFLSQSRSCTLIYGPFYYLQVIAEHGLWFLGISPKLGGRWKLYIMVERWVWRRSFQLIYILDFSPYQIRAQKMPKKPFLCGTIRFINVFRNLTLVCTILGYLRQTFFFFFNPSAFCFYSYRESTFFVRRLICEVVAERQFLDFRTLIFAKFDWTEKYQNLAKKVGRDASKLLKLTVPLTYFTDAKQ